MVFFVGAVTALYCMDKRWLALIIAALCSMGAVFSFLAGWLLWPLIFLMLPFSGYRNWRYLSFWLLATLVTAGLFFLTGYHFTNSSAVNEIAVPFYIYPYYILAYLGSMFAPGSAWSIPLAVTIGILGIGLISINVFFLYRQHVQYRELAFWLLLAGYSVGSAVLSAIGRSGLFIASVSNQLLEPRYVLHTFPFWLAAIFLTLKVLHQIAQNSNLHSSQRLLRRFDHFALGSLLALYVVINGLLIVFIRPVITPDQVACAKAYPVTQDISCMKGIYPDDALNTIQPTLDSLYKNRLSVYRDVSR